MDRSHDELNNVSRARLRSVAARLTDEEFSRPHGNGWTGVAELAHIAFFDRRASRLLERWTRDGVSESSADIDIINDAMLPQWLLLPPRVAVDDAIAAADEVDAAVAALSDDLLTAIVESQVVRLDRARHRSTHLDDLDRRFG